MLIRIVRLLGVRRGDRPMSRGRSRAWGEKNVMKHIAELWLRQEVKELENEAGKEGGVVAEGEEGLGEVPAAGVSPLLHQQG